MTYTKQKLSISNFKIVSFAFFLAFLWHLAIPSTDIYIVALSSIFISIALFSFWEYLALHQVKIDVTPKTISFSKRKKALQEIPLSDLDNIQIDIIHIARGMRTVKTHVTFEVFKKTGEKSQFIIHEKKPARIIKKLVEFGYPAQVTDYESVQQYLKNELHKEEMVKKATNLALIAGGTTLLIGAIIIFIVDKLYPHLGLL